MSSRTGPGLAAVVVALALLAAAARVAWVAGVQLAQRSDLLLESAELASANVIKAGLDLYSPAVYDAVPFTLTMYTPLYFHLLAALPAVEGHPFLTGRLVSLACMLGAAALLFAVPRARRGAWLPALAAAAFLTIWSVGNHVAYLRLDATALLASAGAVTLVRRRTRGAVTAAALCALLAVATKQSHVVAGLTCLAWLWSEERPLARRFAGLYLGGLILGGGLATLAWGEGFWFSVVGVSSTPLGVVPFVSAWMAAASQPLFLLLCLLTAASAAAALAREGLRALRTLELLYTLLALTVSTLTLAKPGSSEVHLFEFMLAQLMWLIVVVDRAGASARPERAGRLAAAGLGAVVAALALDVATTAQHRALVTYAQPDRAQDERVAEAVRARVAAEGYTRPKLLNLGPPAHIYALTDDVCFNDYFLYNVLWTTGRLSHQSLVDAIDRKAFDVVLTTAQLPPFETLVPPWSDLGRALTANYRSAGHDALYSYFVR